MKALITAGPTHEPIDPVRYISNSSSGKMGIALAEELANRGFDVTLIKGPTSITVTNHKINLVNVVTAAEMFNATMQYFTQSDVIVFAAAVADYTPKHPSVVKIKKKEAEFAIELVKTKDIAAELGKLKKPTQISVGFALETDNELKNAQEKLTNKNLDFIILNSINDAGSGFQYDTNKITIIDNKRNVIKFDLKLKTEVAKDIVNYIQNILANKQ